MKPSEVASSDANGRQSGKLKRPRNCEDNISSVSASSGVCDTNGDQSKKPHAALPLKPEISLEKEEKHILYGVPAPPKVRYVLDIDSDHSDAQSCSIYAPDIYNCFRVSELERRPHYNYMETTQSVISPKMRGILIDWIVEVSDSLHLFPDSLYLTVYLIDWFLSQNQIEIQRLQLLGVACMRIAAKYGDIIAPTLDICCSLTTNVYTKKEILELEMQILRYCGCHFSVPTPKTFLRRFLIAAQAFYAFPDLELESLANYLAELTLTEYSFLKFLPSVIAASAVFLARWTLNQNNHPWDSTLEYYTNYKASDLKYAVIELRDLQLNTRNCTLTIIRSKYSEPQCRSVATLHSPKLPDTLF